MDKNAIKKYAIWARTELIARVAQKALQYGITVTTTHEDLDKNVDSVNGKLLSATEKKQRGDFIDQIKAKGFDQVIEEVAYTWFNRFTALRFMEVNGYLPTRVRVFTDEENNFKPQIITEAIHLEMDGLDIEKVYAFKEAHQDEELYKYLLITQCNALNKILPGMFQKISDYTELLLPDNLLREGSVIEQMIALIPEDNFDIDSENGQVEIIGWLYQYYNDEKKNEVINIYKGIVKKTDIPAATQLFTTDWVVRYIIDNSVGRYWIERNPNSALKEDLEYLIKPKNGEIPNVDEKITPQDLTVFDPCMGSAHFLVYAFEVLMKIYVEYGYSEREAAHLIIEHNLFGLDIDDRASQLAYFAVMMKARQYDRRFFVREAQPHVYAMRESNSVDSFTIDYFCENNLNLKNDIIELIKAMTDAKEYGTLIRVPQLDYVNIYTRFEEIKNEISIYRDAVLSELLPLVKIAEVMSKKYAVVATNPPYLNKFDTTLKKFVNENYKDYSGDLFSVFIYRNFDFCKKDGYSGFMTPFVWMFIKTYEKLRNYIIKEKSISTLIQMEYSAFEEATVPICSFVLKNGIENTKGLYIKLSDFKGGMEVQRIKVLEALANESCKYLYENSADNFSKIPGAPIAYWVSNYEFFKFPKIGKDYVSGGRNKTHNNIKYLRNWWEVLIGTRWQPYANGGEYRKWYGNHYDLVDWSDESKKYYATHGGLYNESYWGKEGVCWNLITSSKNGFRIKKSEFHYSSGSPTIISNNRTKDFMTLGFLNTKLAAFLIKMMNPTINTTVNDILNLPLKCIEENKISKIVEQNISLSKTDWDSFETSWDFKVHSLVEFREGNNLQSAFEKWSLACEERFNQLKANEEELNRIFIDTYGLQDELTPEVEEKDVTVRRADLTRDIKSFISYAVGCMFGRYALDTEGLAYAGGDWDASKYVKFPADQDNIIPICDDEYFEDDILGRFVKFVEVVYGAESLDENLKFIAEALGGKGSPKEVIRKYFLTDFFGDHCKIYQKRPIYWLFDSGKKNGFKALIYMHRYQPDTIARIRTDYVHEQQSRYRTAIADLEQRINGASTSERVKLNKELTKLKDQEAEIRTYEEKIHHLADQMLSIDLDDGVKHNYDIFKDVLAKIK